METESGPIVLFDGVCNLCNGLVQFLIKKDRRSVLRFASLQGNFGQRIRREMGEPKPHGDSLIFLDNGKVYTQSTASLRIVRYLGGGWPLLWGLMIFPRFIRDTVYRWVAKNRYRWFGQRATCMVPEPALQHRFID